MPPFHRMYFQRVIGTHYSFLYHQNQRINQSPSRTPYASKGPTFNKWPGSSILRRVCVYYKSNECSPSPKQFPDPGTAMPHPYLPMLDGDRLPQVPWARCSRWQLDAEWTCIFVIRSSSKCCQEIFWYYRPHIDQYIYVLICQMGADPFEMFFLPRWLICPSCSVYSFVELWGVFGSQKFIPLYVKF
jgi:hypothetical protein